jgi:hypothetical protein
METSLNRFMRYCLAAVIFLVICSVPFFIWEWARESSPSLWWVMGLSLIVWLPLTIWLGYLGFKMFIDSTAPR